MEKIQQNALKNAHLRVERCEISRKVLVSNITKLYDEQALQFYFESKRRSGGGTVTNVELLGNGEARISFADCAGTCTQILLISWSHD